MSTWLTFQLPDLCGCKEATCVFNEEVNEEEVSKKILWLSFFLFKISVKTFENFFLYKFWVWHKKRKKKEKKIKFTIFTCFLSFFHLQPVPAPVGVWAFARMSEESRENARRLNLHEEARHVPQVSNARRNSSWPMHQWPNHSKSGLQRMQRLQVGFHQQSADFSCVEQLPMFSILQKYSWF